MVILKLNLANGNTTDGSAAESNITLPYEDYNHGTTVIKELVDTWIERREIVVSSDYYFSSVKSSK